MLSLLLGFLKKEIMQLLRTPAMRVFVFFMPIMQLIIFGFAISNEVKNIKLAISMAPNDRAAYDIYKKCLASTWFIPAKTTFTDPYEIVQSNQADAIIISPAETLDKAIERGEGEIQLLINSTNVVRARAVENYVKAILMSLYPPESKPLIKFDVRILYNPTLETSFFMVPGVMALVLSILTTILTAMSLAREKELGTIETIISAPIKSWQIVVGKIFPFILIGFLDVVLVLLAAKIIFGVPIRGPLPYLAIASFAYICSTVSVGIFIATLAKNQQQSAMGGLIYNFPSILLSGLIFPIENMPLILKGFAIINPMSHYVYLLRNIFLKGGNSTYVLEHTAILFLMGTIALFISFKKFKNTLG